MTRYDLFYFALAPVAVPVIAWRALTKSKYRESLPGMFGRGWNPADPSLWQNGSIWLHAVSYGEAMAAKALLPLLRTENPHWPLVLTTVTETGQSLARSFQPAFADHVCYFPADLSPVVKRFVRTFQPRLMVIMETELWPNAIMIAAQAGAHVIVANGRISDKSFPNYMRLRRVLRQPLSHVRAFCMQTETDAKRVRAIVGEGARVFVTGNCKFDAPPRPLEENRRAELLRRCGIPPTDPVIVVGSTHAGEEEIVLRAFEEVRVHIPSLRLILAPRHPERFDTVWQLLGKTPYSCCRFSETTARGSLVSTPDIVLVDQMGVLAELYGIATVGVVAGSFVPGIGGHNLLEAAAHAVPVVYGPFMDKQPELVRILTKENGGLQVSSAELGTVLVKLLEDPSLRAELGKRASQAVERQRGAAARTMDVIRQVLHER